MLNTDKKRTLEGKFYKAANGYESYEIFYATPDIIFEVSDILVARFGCSPIDLPMYGLGVVITKCQKGDIKLDLGWDNWSGFYIFANSPEGDDLVKDIGTYLNTILSGNDFEKYIHYW